MADSDLDAGASVQNSEGGGTNVPSGEPKREYLTFSPDDGPFVWKVNGNDGNDDRSFLIVCDEDAESVMRAISQLYPLKDFTIRGMKMLDGIVGCIQVAPYEEWRSLRKAGE